MNTCHLLLGSNLGNSEEQMKIARDYISDYIGAIHRFSSLYQTAAWGNTLQPDFLNQVIIISTGLTAFQTMEKILSIEEKMGRIRMEKNAARIIDIDILFFNREIISTPTLVVPHPMLQLRRFVLEPLLETSEDFVHPVLNKNIRELLAECPDTLAVKRI